MKFTEAHITAFYEASHDLNPLHVDAEYARRSQFGKPVVYGMAAVVYGLGAWAKGRNFKLQHLRAVFRKPLFVGEEYALLIEENDPEVSIKFRKGPVDYAVIHLTMEWLDMSAIAFPQAYAHVPLRKEAAAEPLAEAQTVHYSMNIQAWPELTEAFGLQPESIPAHQISALLWASYHVGMVLPGRQALFSELKLDFTPQNLHSVQIQVELEAAEFDDRFNRYTLTGKGSGIESAYIAAFRRPLPVDFPLAAMPVFAAGYLPLKDKVVFISGATRGFGAAMARVCALAGARLVLNYRGDARAAYALCAELKQAGAQAVAFSADMADPVAVADMAGVLSARFGRLDMIVNNAAPPIRDLQFLEQDNAHIQQFVQQNLAITLETARQLIPLLSEGGQFVHISTKYLVEPVRGFAHYLTAKAAQEALVQALALEFRDQEFMVARLPRILTDQTNLAFDFDPPLHPGEVARELVLELVGEDGDGNFRVVDLDQNFQD